MNKANVLACTLLICSLAAMPARAVTVLLNEDFNGTWSTTNPPAGWTIYYDGDTSTNDWHRAPDLGADPWPDNDSTYALMFGMPQEMSEDSLMSPGVDCSGFNAVAVRCSIFFQGSGTPYFARLMGSYSGQPFEQLVYDYAGRVVGPGLQVYYLPWAAGRRDVRLAWIFRGGSGQIGFWAVDNVTILADSVDADVGCTGIVAPTDTVDSGQNIIPRAWVKNFKTTVADSFFLHMNVGFNYQQQVVVRNLPGGESLAVDLPAWNVFGRGPLTVTAWTELFGDADPANDTSTGQCFVRVRDVGVTEILAPRDTVDSGTAIIPQATLHNSGTDTANFYAHFRIDAWTDSVLVDLMWPGEDRLIQSPSAWPGNAAGPMTVRCSTGWAVDPNPRNDTMSRGFFVRWPHFKDLAATAILSPGSAVRESATVTPSGIIGGSTTEPATFMAYFKICNAGGVVYEDSQPGLVNPGTTDTVDFLPWLAAPQGAYTDSLKVVADGDRNPTNDTASSMFQVMAGFHDVGVVSILSPADTIQTGPVTPTVIVKNYGSFPETFTARFRVTPGYIPTYYDSAVISGLAPDSSVVVAFPVWNASSGTHVSRCSLEVADIQPGNDWQEKTVFVESLQIPFGWYPMKDYPGGAAGKMVKDGGWLVYDPGTRLIFCAKGNKTAEFAAYYQVGDSWQALASIPLGLEAKATSKGGAGCSDGNGTLYATKGNNTLGFHQYAYAGNSWLQKKDVPIGVYGKKVKGGTSLCHALSQGQPWVYMLKGYKNEFWRYDPVGDTWDSLDMAPVGANLKWDKGSWIVYDGNHTIYAHKAKYFEFYAYDTDTDIWFDTLRPMPKPGATGDKKPGDGGCGAWDNGTIMAMKGNNTQQVWRYFAAQDAWIEQDTIPKGTSGKKVKAGAGMVSPSRGIFFATKGNKTLDFWRYRPATGTGVREQYTAALALPEGTELQVRPNPFSRTALVGVPSAAGALLLRVYDIRGNVVHEQVARAGWNNLDLTGAPPGVYFLRPGSANVCARLVKE